MEQFENLFKCCNKNALITNLAGIGLGAMLGYGLLTYKYNDTEFKIPPIINNIENEPETFDFIPTEIPDAPIGLPDIPDNIIDVEPFNELKEKKPNILDYLDNVKSVGYLTVSIAMAGGIILTLYKPAYAVYNYLNKNRGAPVQQIKKDINLINDSNIINNDKVLKGDISEQDKNFLGKDKPPEQQIKKLNEVKDVYKTTINDLNKIINIIEKHEKTEEKTIEPINVKINNINYTMNKEQYLNMGPRTQGKLMIDTFGKITTMFEPEFIKPINKEAVIEIKENVELNKKIDNYIKKNIRQESEISQTVRNAWLPKQQQFTDSITRNMTEEEAKKFFLWLDKFNRSTSSLSYVLKIENISVSDLKTIKNKIISLLKSTKPKVFNTINVIRNILEDYAKKYPNLIKIDIDKIISDIKNSNDKFIVLLTWYNTLLERIIPNDQYRNNFGGVKDPKLKNFILLLNKDIPQIINEMYSVANQLEDINKEDSIFLKKLADKYLEAYYIFLYFLFDAHELLKIINDVKNIFL